MTAQQPGAETDLGAGERPCPRVWVYPLLDAYRWCVLSEADRHTMRAMLP